MKYAYNGIDNPELLIELSQENQTIKICIEDNGIGLPKGFKIDEADSLGLQLVHTLLEQIEGTLVLKVEKGTKYFITFEKVT
jgi:two-component sensor histidine kinase